MDKVFNALLPLFAMVLCGYWAVRLRIVGKETVKGLVGIVFWLFLPCFIFIKTLGARDHGSLDWTLLFAYYSACLLVFLIAAMGGAALSGNGLRTAFLRGLASISGVVGYMGLPLIAMAFEESAILPALMITMADNLVILAGGALMMEMTASEPSARRNLVQIVGSTLKGIATNPLIVSVGAAVLFMLADIELPGPVSKFAVQMTNATGPLALVALGAALATHESRGFAKTDVVMLAVLKTIVLPLAVFLSSKYVFGLSALDVKIAVLMAALPIAVNVFILAARYQTYELTVSSAMMLSTLFGVIVMSWLIVSMV